MQFEGVLSQPDPSEDLRKIVDPRLGDNYPVDSVRKVRTSVNKPFRVNNFKNVEPMVTVLHADGSTSESVYTGKSSTASEYEIHCGCSYDTFFNYRRLGYWLLLRKSKSCESYVGKIGLNELVDFVRTMFGVRFPTLHRLLKQKCL